MAQMTCPKCGIDLVPVERTKGFSMVGVFSAIGLLVGLFTMLSSFGLGAVIAVVSIIIGIFARGKDTYLICPSCKNETGPL